MTASWLPNNKHSNSTLRDLKFRRSRCFDISPRPRPYLHLQLPDPSDQPLVLGSVGGRLVSTALRLRPQCLVQLRLLLQPAGELRQLLLKSCGSRARPAPPAQAGRPTADGQQAQRTAAVCQQPTDRCWRAAAVGGGGGAAAAAAGANAGQNWVSVDFQ